MCELSSTGSVTATNTFGPSGLISRHTSSGSVFYAFDYRNSVAQRLNSSGGTVLSSQTFDAYGTRLSTDGNTDPYAGFGGQAGYYTDWETGTASSALELLTFRYYDPSAGRFLNRDPIGHSGGANVYEYVNNGPTGATDTSGLEEGFNLTAIFAACAGAIIGIASQGDPCYKDYNICLRWTECIADGLAAVAGALFFMACPECSFFGSVGLGCAEGFIAAILHAAGEQICDALIPCTPKDQSLLCQLAAAAVDTLDGCLDGAVGSILEGFDIKGIAESVIETIFAAFGNGFEESDCVGVL